MLPPLSRETFLVSDPSSASSPSEGINPAACNDETIQKAAWHGHTEVVRLLLEDPRTDPTALHNEEIRLAAENGHTEVVELLLL